MLCINNILKKTYKNVGINLNKCGFLEIVQNWNIKIKLCYVNRVVSK